MQTLRDLHLYWRDQDQRIRAASGNYPLLNDPAAPHCRGAIDHDPDRAGLCRWCGAKVAAPIPKPSPPYRENDGSKAIREAYAYHFNPDWPNVNGEFWDA